MDFPTNDAGELPGRDIGLNDAIRKDRRKLPEAHSASKAIRRKSRPQSAMTKASNPASARRNRTACTIIALLLCGAAPAPAQNTPSTPQHVPLEKRIGEAGPEIVPSLIVINARGASLQGGQLTLAGTEFDRLRGPAGAGGGSFPHDRLAERMVAEQR